MEGHAATDSAIWQEANRAYLRVAIRRLRLLLHRRVLWLRQVWKQDPLQGYQGMVIGDGQADCLLAEGDDRAEQRFYRDSPEAAAISHDLETVENERAVTCETLPSLEVLARSFRLNAFERDVLTLCVAPELDPSFERLYAYVQDDVTRKYPTAHLALTLFGSSENERGAARESFLPDAPLRRHRLLRLESSPTSNTSSVPMWAHASEPFALDRRVTDYILGRNRMDEQVASLVKRVESTPFLTDEQKGLVEGVQCLLKDENSRSRVSPFNLVGPPRVGRRAVASAVCGRLGVTLYFLELARLPAPGREVCELGRLLDREAVLLPIAYYLDLSEADPSSRSEISAANQIVEETQTLMFVASRDRWRGGRELSVLAVPKANAVAQLSLWRAALARETGVRANGTAEGARSVNSGISPSSAAGPPWNGFLASIVQQFDFGAQEIHRTVQTVGALARVRNPQAPQVNAEDLWQACRTLAAQPLHDLAQRLIPCYTWEDIVLPEDTAAQLRELAAQVAHRAQVYETWGFGAKLGRGHGIAALFAGPSGTGKTMAAEVVANHLKLDLYRIDLSGVVSKYIGETEKNLRRVFDAAEQSGAILFFDEADALFGKRSEVKDSHDRYANIEINYLLQRMEEYRGLAILATNMKSLLDQAFLRRLRFLIDFPFPDAVHRKQIWQRVFPAQAEVEGLEYGFLSRLEIAGGNIRNIALNAAFLAADEAQGIRMEHVLHAARREYAKIDKLMSESEFGSYYTSVRR